VQFSLDGQLGWAQQQERKIFCTPVSVRSKSPTNSVCFRVICPTTCWTIDLYAGLRARLVLRAPDCSERTSSGIAPLAYSCDMKKLACPPSGKVSSARVWPQVQRKYDNFCFSTRSSDVERLDRLQSPMMFELKNTYETGPLPVRVSFFRIGIGVILSEGAHRAAHLAYWCASMR